jgi:protein gp37
VCSCFTKRAAFAGSIDAMRSCPATVHFLSLETLLGPLPRST